MTMRLGNTLDANSNKIINLANGTDPGDAVTFSQLTASVTGLLELKGTLDASTNPNYPSGVVGDSYIINGNGKVGGVSGEDVTIGDLVVCQADNAGGDQATVGNDWFVLEMNLNQATETVAGYAELSTQAETDTGTNDTTIVTPLKLHTKPLGGGCYRYIRFDNSSKCFRYCCGENRNCNISGSEYRYRCK